MLINLVAAGFLYGHHLAVIELGRSDVLVKSLVVSPTKISLEPVWRVPLDQADVELSSVSMAPGGRYAAVVLGPKKPIKSAITRVLVLDMTEHTRVRTISTFPGEPVWDKDNSLVVRVGQRISTLKLARCRMPNFIPEFEPNVGEPRQSDLDAHLVKQCVEVLTSSGVGTPPSYARSLSWTFYANSAGGIIGSVSSLPGLESIALFGQANWIDSRSRQVADLLLLRKADSYRPIVISAGHRDCWLLKLTPDLLFFGSSDPGHRELLIFSLETLAEVDRMPTTGLVIVVD